ncbi:prolipoprotein diacylglyceryl transferase [Nocardia asteroides]|uniref:prolipoprotein diacylglyceryl transferase n=1 Tax=Nocardia asteroides TaxID=1824 RepID=UPI001E44C064|nr:prolipoprotein diacylglyceryl transferase [Nocardia asteroides]UGT58728.1 prolipoprotein diacylglyceryl transferase [Nocardia asteroides]
MVAVNSVLAYIPSPPQGVWQLGPFPLRAYALFIILGIVVAIWWGERRWQQRGGKPGAVLDVAMFAVPFGLVGGRLYHVATDWQKYFGPGKHPIEALYIWQGGLGIWGAVFLGGVGAWIGCRIYKIPLPALGDAIAPAVLLAQAIGRLGNYFNQELYGRTTEVPWGLEIYERFDAETGARDMMNGVSTGRVLEVVHPTFLYELVWNVLVVILLVQLDKRFKIGHGRLFALYVAGYSFGRFFVELMRSDEATHILGIRINSFTSAIVFLCAMAYFALATKGRETPAQLQPDGEPRPWPWQFSALRAAGAADNAAATETTAAQADSKDEKAAEPAEGETATASAGSGDETPGTGEDEAAGTEAESGDKDDATTVLKKS